MTSLEKIFIEKEIYEVIKKAGDRDNMIELIGEGLKPYAKKLRREIQREEILKLAEIPVRRISKFDRKKTDELLKELDADIAITEENLDHITDYAIAHFKNLLKNMVKAANAKRQSPPLTLSTQCMWLSQTKSCTSTAKKALSAQDSRKKNIFLTFPNMMT